MKPERTIDMGGFYIKKYRFDNPVNPLDFVQNLLDLGLNITKITVKESVESDMQSLDGASFEAGEFITQYDQISSRIRDGSFEIRILYNNLPTFITIADLSDTAALTTVMEDLDLREILQQRTDAV